MSEQLRERRAAELEMLQSAFDASEIEIRGGEDNSVAVKRTFRYPPHVVVQLTLRLPSAYPIGDALVEAAVVRSGPKFMYEYMSRWKESLQKVVEQWKGSELVFAVLAEAELGLQALMEEQLAHNMNEETVRAPPQSVKPELWGRRLIYSHHIISKTKRTDMQRLASDLELTGYCKIGWPGLVILEGRDLACQEFYETMRRWNWKYLTVRGEMHEPLAEAEQCFEAFVETDDMSIVADHCRRTGLESLFRTSMKVHDREEAPNSSTQQFGVLAHIDHMNRPKAYVKWLRRAAQDCRCLIIIRQCSGTILVGIVGDDRASTQLLLKKWRTQRVDVDAKGKPCQERMMKVLCENLVTPSTKVDWDSVVVDPICVSREALEKLLGMIGGDLWKQEGLNILNT